MKGIIILLIICSVLNAVCWGYVQPSKVLVEFNSGVLVDAEVAVDKAKGLMFRESLGDSQGMLFDFQLDGSYTFWMKNMNFPVDMVWINSDFQVVKVIEGAQPCDMDCPLYTSEKPAQYILEVPANFASKNNLKVGDIANLDGLYN